jgi:hypothetical protein
MVAHGGPRVRELEARRTTIVGKKMRLTPPISRRRDLERLITLIVCMIRELVHEL